MDGALVLDDLFHKSEPCNINAPMLQWWGMDVDAMAKDTMRSGGRGPPRSPEGLTPQVHRPRRWGGATGLGVVVRPALGGIGDHIPRCTPSRRAWSTTWCGMGAAVAGKRRTQPASRKGAGACALWLESCVTAPRSRHLQSWLRRNDTSNLVPGVHRTPRALHCEPRCSQRASTSTWVCTGRCRPSLCIVFGLAAVVGSTSPPRAARCSGRLPLLCPTPIAPVGFFYRGWSGHQYTGCVRRRERRPQSVTMIFDTGAQRWRGGMGDILSRSPFDWGHFAALALRIVWMGAPSRPLLGATALALSPAPFCTLLGPARRLVASLKRGAHIEAAAPEPCPAPSRPAVLKPSATVNGKTLSRDQILEPPRALLRRGGEGGGGCALRRASRRSHTARAPGAAARVHHRARAKPTREPPHAAWDPHERERSSCRDAAKCG